jgi:hypothetical protein
MSAAVHRSPNKLWRSNSIFLTMVMTKENVSKASV